ncbi:hypothetical protein [Methylorubrum sp. SB2]|uniref:hypothetical protein n=1 Tax=Methylorubrum subtropicum TaxID=3138812 RepID=UPI00313E9DDD
MFSLSDLFPPCFRWKREPKSENLHSATGGGAICYPVARRSHMSTRSAEYYLRPEHLDGQVSVLIRKFARGERVSSLSAHAELTAAGNMSVQAGRVLLAAETALRRSGITVRSEWVATGTGKRIKVRWLCRDGLRKLADLAAAGV